MLARFIEPFFLTFCSLCPHGHAGRATGHIGAVFESHKDPVRCGIKWHVAVALDKDPKGRRRVGVDLRGHTGTDR